MSGDELFALITSIIVGCIGWRSWISGMLFVRNYAGTGSTKSLAGLWALVSAVSVLFVLLRWSSYDVKSDPVYIFFYFMMWFGWSGALLTLLPYAGLNARDDMLERHNRAAALAVGGALLGGTLTFAGGNIGDGPGWWVVVFCALLANGSQLLMWIVGSRFSRVEEAISVERDTAAGWRTLGFFVGTGLILGRAVAGNWHSAVETAGDFITRGWPALLLWGVAFIMDVLFRTTPAFPNRPVILCGVLPGLCLAVMGLLAALAQGAWL